MRTKYVFVGMLLGLALSVVLAVAVVAWVLLKPPPETSSLPPTPGGDVVLWVSEGYLTDMASDMARSQEPAIRQVLVDIGPDGRVDTTVTAEAIIAGVRLQLRIQANGGVSLVESRIQFRIHKVGLLGVGIPIEALPTSLRAAVEALPVEQEKQLNDMLKEAGLVPVGVTTDDKAISIALAPRK
jgi:hypothetical protein